MLPGRMAGYFNLHTSCADCLDIGDPQRLEPKVPVQVCTRIALSFHLLQHVLELHSLTPKMEAGCSAEMFEPLSCMLHGVENKTVSCA